MDNIKVYLFEECDYVITDLNKQDTIEWYKKEYGFDENDELICKKTDLSKVQFANDHYIEKEIKRMGLPQIIASTEY